MSRRNSGGGLGGNEVGPARKAVRGISVADVHPGLMEFAPGNLERAKGIEPSISAWEAQVLPLNDARFYWWISILRDAGI